MEPSSTLETRQVENYGHQARNENTKEATSQGAGLYEDLVSFRNDKNDKFHVPNRKSGAFAAAWQRRRTGMRRPLHLRVGEQGLPVSKRAWFGFGLWWVGRHAVVVRKVHK